MNQEIQNIIVRNKVLREQKAQFKARLERVYRNRLDSLGLTRRNSRDYEQAAKDIISPEFEYLEFASDICDLIGITKDGEIALIELKYPNRKGEIGRPLKPKQIVASQVFGRQYQLRTYFGNRVDRNETENTELSEITPAPNQGIRETSPDFRAKKGRVRRAK